jgi:very-short-patch-repair endonuclease
MVQKTFPRVRGTSRSIQEEARKLRKAMTPAEQTLWEQLRSRRLQGLKFRRQHPVGRFIVDFYCAEHRLVIELDGDIHQGQQEYDQARTETLQGYGYRVLRFSNDMVLQHIERVLEMIVAAATPLPSPRIGRGKGPGDR